MLDGENRPVLTEREILRNLQAIVADADQLPVDVLRALATAWTPHAATAQEDCSSSAGSPPECCRPGVRLLVSARFTDSLLMSFPPLSAWRHHADILLLRPRRSFDGDVFGVSLAGHGMGGPPGRGYWLRRGTVEPVQTPAPPGTTPVSPAAPGT